MRTQNQPSPELSSGRFRRRRLTLGALLGAAAIAGGVSLALAEPSLQDKIDSASSEVDRISGKVGSQQADVAELEADARAAGARAMQLSAQVEETVARSEALADELAAAEKRLEEVQARYKRALGVLNKRLIEIYKSGKPDGLTILLEADGYEDLQTRAEFLDELHDADERIAERVEALHDEVEAKYNEIADLKNRLDEEAARLDSARAEFDAAQADAEKRAAALGEVLAASRSNLDDAEGRLADLEAEQQEQSGGGGSAFLGGPYAIPTYIVMCESGGNYRALNPSSMAGGAYQIIPSTWHAYGGKGYAHQASKAEQDRIAGLIWEDVGPSAWSCA